MKFLSFLFVVMLSSRAFAGVYGELNLLYNTDTFTTASTATSSKTYYALDVYANLENKNIFYGGFHVDQFTSQENPSGTQTSLSSLNMGPMFLWVIDRKKTFTFSAGYNIVARGSYNNGSQTETLNGTGLFASFAAMPEIAENWYVGIRMNYYSLSFPKSTVGSTTTDVSYSRSMIFPTISVAWRN